LEAFHNCVEIVGTVSLDQAQLSQASDMIYKVLTDCYNRRNELLEGKTEEDIDEEELEQIDEETSKEEEILSGVADTIGALVKTHKELFLPYFQNQLLAVFTDMLSEQRTNHERQVALCVFDDVMEHCGPHAVALLPSFLPSMIRDLTDPDPAVRQAAVFGIGVVSYQTPAQLAPHVIVVVEKLKHFIEKPDSRTKENGMATDNAISSIGKIAQSQSNVIDPVALFALWLSYLPIFHDKEESKIVYSQLCSLVESNNAFVLGANNVNLHKILTVFGQIIGTDLIDPPLQVRIVNILKQIQPNVLQASWQNLSPEQQAKLRNFA